VRITKNALGENHPTYAKCLNGLAMVYQFMGEYEKAIPLYTQTRDIYKKTLGENHFLYATSLNGLAVLYDNMGVYAKAEPLFTQVMQIAKNALGENHPDYASSLNNLGMLYSEMGRYAKAEPLLTQALQIRKIALGEDHPDYAISLSNLAGLNGKMGRYAKAEPLLTQALQIRKIALGEDHPDYATNLDSLAKLYVATNRINDGLMLMKEVSLIDDRMIGQIFSFGSEEDRLTYLSLVRPDVEKFLSLVFQHFSRSPAAIQDALALILKRKAITSEALAVQRDVILGGRYPHLREKLQKLHALRMQIAQKTIAGPGKEGADAHRRYLSEWNAEKERLETDLAQQIPEIKLEANFRNADRFVIAHTLPPNSALLEFFRFREFDFTAIPAQGQRQWKSARYCVFVLPSGDPDNISLIDLGGADQIDCFIARYKSKLTSERRTLPDTASQNHPNNSEQGIFSRLSEKKTHDEDEPLSSKHGTISEYDPLVIEKEDGLQIYSALIAPLRNALGDCSYLIVAPDSQISTIPFEVIPTPEGEYLIDQYHLSYVGVGRDVLRFIANPQGKPGKALVMASPDFDLRAEISLERSTDALVAGRISRQFSRDSLYFPPLKGTTIEGEHIGSLVGTKPLMEKDALESKLKSVVSPIILHVATHGFFLTDQETTAHKEGRDLRMLGDMGMQRFSGCGMENPMLRSGLAFAGVNTWLNRGELPPEAEDGILTAEDVSGLDLTNTALAVLSACDTGIGDVKTGEGVFGLRRSFILAGARTLVMSLWKVPDTPTQELMVDFYRRLLKGIPKADALRESQLKIRNKYPHPQDWGAFICQGEPGPILDIK